MAPRFLALRACYEQALENAPTLGGRVDVALTFSVEGQASTSIAPPVGGAMLAACWRAALAGLALPERPAAEVTVLYPLFLFPGAGAPARALREAKVREARAAKAPCSAGAQRVKGGHSTEFHPCGR